MALPSYLLLSGSSFHLSVMTSERGTGYSLVPMCPDSTATDASATVRLATVAIHGASTSHLHFPTVGPTFV